MSFVSDHLRATGFFSGIGYYKRSAVRTTKRGGCSTVRIKAKRARGTGMNPEEAYRDEEWMGRGGEFRGSMERKD
jgi:hypothetical protein